MDAVLQQAINKMVEEVSLMEEELRKNPLFDKIKQKKALVNQLAQSYGAEIIYKDVLGGEATGSGFINIHSGMFKGWTFSKAAQWYIEQRGKANPPTFEELMEALKNGDWDGTVTNARTTLLKNNQISFLKSSGAFGLTKWYKTGKKSKSGQDTDDTEDGEETTEATEEQEEGNTLTNEKAGEIFGKDAKETLDRFDKEKKQ